MDHLLEYVFPDLLWAGSELSLEMARRNYTALMQQGAVDLKMFAEKDGDEEDVPYTFSKQGEVGVVSIRGPLVNRDSFFNRIFGMTSYTEIGRSISYAARDSSVKAILLDIDSGGGAMSGCADCSDLIKAVHDKVKPVYAFTPGTMASAAYSLGCSGGEISASKSAITGSLGVITTHMSLLKMLQKEGVEPTVLREGKFKALASQFEPLSPEAEAQIRAMMKGAYGVLLTHVAERRHTTYEDADARMGQGREFFGAQGLAAGLVDHIESFDQVMGRINATLLDNASRNKQNPAHSHTRFHMSTTRPALTDLQMAALAAGVPEALASASGTPVAQGAAPAANTPEQAATPEQAPAAGIAGAAVVPQTDPAAPAATTATPAEHQAAAQPVQGVQPAQSADANGVLTFFQGQVMSLTTEVGTLRAELAASKGRIAELEGNQSQLAAIAGRSLSTMRVALGGVAPDTTKMSVPALLAEHAAASSQFASSFKVGGVAATNAAETAAPSLQSDPLFPARVAAARVASRSK